VREASAFSLLASGQLPSDVVRFDDWFPLLTSWCTIALPSSVSTKSYSEPVDGVVLTRPRFWHFAIHQTRCHHFNSNSPENRFRQLMFPQTPCSLYHTFGFLWRNSLLSCYKIRQN